MKKYTKDELDELYNNPMAYHLAKLAGLDLHKIIEEEKKAIDEEMEEMKGLHEYVQKTLDDMVKEGTLECEEKTENGVTTKYYHSVKKNEETEDVPEETCKEEVCETEEKKEYVKPEAKVQPFLMSAEQLETFINNYRSLVEAEKKLSYVYGIEFQDGNSGFGFPSKVNEIIWDFMRIIFGDENAEDIADYIFGNSNFDDVKSLYDELV